MMAASIPKVNEIRARFLKIEDNGPLGTVGRRAVGAPNDTPVEFKVEHVKLLVRS
jgi:hypothetical protein